MSLRIAISILSFGVWLAAGCSAPSSCTPGQSIACACTDGRMGAQVCTPSHNYAACACAGGGNGGNGGGNGGNGGGGEGDMAMSHPATARRIFVTKTSYASTAAPTACQKSAEAAGLVGTWVPWLSYYSSGGDNDVIDKITSNGPWKLITGEVAFQNHGQLGTAPSVPISITEMGNALLGGEFVWTGTSTGGTTSMRTCQSWSEVGNLFDATVGSPVDVDRWTAATTASCTESHHVYCLEL